MVSRGPTPLTQVVLTSSKFRFLTCEAKLSTNYSRSSGLVRHAGPPEPFREISSPE